MLPDGPMLTPAMSMARAVTVDSDDDLSAHRPAQHPTQHSGLTTFHFVSNGLSLLSERPA